MTTDWDLKWKDLPKSNGKTITLGNGSNAGRAQVADLFHPAVLRERVVSSHHQVSRKKSYQDHIYAERLGTTPGKYELV